MFIREYSRLNGFMNWSDLPFIKYLQRVDETLDAFYGRTAGPEDFETLQQLHDKNIAPDTAAMRLMRLPLRPGLDCF